MKQNPNNMFCFFKDKNWVKPWVFVVCSFFAFQVQAKEITVDGFYITLAGDTVKTKFVVHVRKGRLITDIPKTNSKKNTDDLYYSQSTDPDLKFIPIQSKLQWKINVIDEKGKKKKIEPGQIKWFRLFIEKDSFSYHSFQNDLFAKRYIFEIDRSQSCVFLLLLIDGPLKLYQYNSLEHSEFVKNTGLNYSNVNGPPKIILPRNHVKYCLQKGNGELHDISGWYFRNSLKEYLSDDYALSQKIDRREYGKNEIVTIVREYNSYVNSLR